MSRPALLAAARIARRQAWLSKGRSLLAISLVALPIAGLAGAGTVIATAVPSREERATSIMGSAELWVANWPQRNDKVSATRQPTPADVEAVLPSGSHLVTSHLTSREFVRNGSYFFLSFFEYNTPIDAPPLQGKYHMIQGRPPRAAGEAAVDPGVLAELHVPIGGQLTLRDVSVHVIGTVVDPLHLREPVAVVGPGTLADIRDAQPIQSAYVDLPPGSNVSEIAQQLTSLLDPQEESMPCDANSCNSNVRTRGQFLYYDASPRLASAIAFAGAVVGVFATGLIVVAAFAVGIRRQLRLFGLVGASGADPRQLRTIVLFGGTTIGVVGSLVGIGIGVGVTYAAAPFIGRFTGSMPGSVDLNPLVMVGALILGTAGATLAAAAPAKTAARLATVDALAMRLPAPPLPRRTAWRGIVLFVAGAIVTAWSTGTREKSGLAVGLVAMLAGALLSIPLLVATLGRIAGRLPGVWRLAARDSARYGRRTAAALAAAALALMAPIAVSAASLSEEAREANTPRLGNDQMLISFLAYFDEPTRPLEALAGPLKSAFPGAIVEPLRRAVFPAGSFTPFDEAMGPNDDYPASVAFSGPSVVENGAITTYGGELMIGTPDILRALGAESATPALRAGSVVAIGVGSTDHGTVKLDQPPRKPGERSPTRSLSAVEVHVPHAFNESIPRFMISEDAASRLGMAPARDTGLMLFDTPKPLRTEDIRRVKDVVAKHPNAFAQSAADLLPRTLGPVRAALTVASALIALAIVGVSVALVRAEARRDQAILSAVGASPGTRRKLVGASASMLALMAALIALPAGFVPVAIIERVRSAAVPLVIPWLVMAAVLFLVPLVAGAVAALTSRGPKASAMLQPLA